MSTHLRQWWEYLRASYWFLPAAMGVTAVALSFVTVTLDEHLRDDMVQSLGWIYTGGAAGARAVLSTIASSSITVAGVTFSITIVTLSLASSQFGPRLLRNFMRDTGSQVVLGAFTSTHLYCLLVLRSVRGIDDALYVPHLSVTVGVLLAVLGVAVLIYFIHHVAESIQVSHVVQKVSSELEHAIERLFPQSLGKGAAVHLPAMERTKPSEPRHLVDADRTGYIQNIDAEELFKSAREQDVLVSLLCRPGDFVAPGVRLAEISPPERVNQKFVQQLLASFTVGGQRTTTQDAEFAFEQLVEIALRALSPGINDPFTARHCLDYLAAGLCRLTARALPSRYRLDGDNVLRLVTPPVTYARFAEVAFAQIAEASDGHSAVRERLRQHIHLVRSTTAEPELLSVLEKIALRLPDSEA